VPNTKTNKHSLNEPSVVKAEANLKVTIPLKETECMPIVDNCSDNQKLNKLGKNGA